MVQAIDPTDLGKQGTRKIKVQADNMFISPHGIKFQFLDTNRRTILQRTSSFDKAKNWA